MVASAAPPAWALWAATLACVATVGCTGASAHALGSPIALAASPAGGPTTLGAPGPFVPAAGPAALGNGSGWMNLTAGLHANATASSLGQMFYDPALASDVLIPGTNNSFGQWFSYANDSWTGHVVGTGLAIPGVAASWDPATDEGVTFGGQSGGVGLGQNVTCTLSGTAWGCTDGYGAPAPGDRWGAGLAWDPSDGYLLLFGGVDGTTRFNDTWEFNGSGWTELRTAIAPSPRFDSVMVEDPQIDGVLLFGGNGTNGTLLNDTWLFQHGTWRPMDDSLAPSARFEAYAAYDAPIGSVVLFGGLNRSGGPQSDLWYGENGGWEESPATFPLPSLRAGGELATAPTGNGLLLFGGQSGQRVLNDTWLFYTINPQVVASPLDGEGVFSVSFAASVEGGVPPLNLLWSFGDGGSATGLETSHYFAVGRYLVELTVTDEYGVQGHYELTVTDVVPFAFTAGLAPTLGPAPLTVSAASSPTDGAPPYTVHWRFGNGADFDAANATTTYSVPGSYPVDVWGNDSFGRSFHQTFEVVATAGVVPPRLNVSVVPNRSAGIAPAAFSFAVVAPATPGPTTFHWSFGDGTEGVGPLVTHAFAAAGRYAVNVSAMSAGGVTGSATTAVTVGPPLSVALAYTTVAGTAGDLVRWSASASGGIAPYRYFWQLGNGSGAEGANVTALYDRSGIVQGTVEVLDAQGDHAAASANVTVDVVPLPHPNTPSPSSALVGTLDVVAASAAVGIAVGALAAVLAFRYRVLRPPSRVRRGRTGRAPPGPPGAVRRRPARPGDPTAPRSPPGRTRGDRRPPPPSP